MPSGPGMANGPVMANGPGMSNGPGMAGGPMMPNGMAYGNRNGGFDFQSQASDFGSPLSHLNDSVASLDHLAAMEKSLNHHEQVTPSLFQSATSVDKSVCVFVQKSGK